MKRKSSRRSGKSDEDENGIDEIDNGEEPRVKKGRKSKGRKSKHPEKAVAESDSELETSQLDEDDNDAVKSKENGNNQEKQGRKSKGKKSKKDTESELESTEETDPLAEDNDDAEYEVQAVLDHKTMKGVLHYLIRWKGYTEESDTWEPEDTLDCQNLIDEYKKKGKTKKGGKKKSLSKDEDGNTWDENEDFEVDRIIDVYFHKNGKRDFLVSWKGYPASQNSWEPEDNMDCKDLIEKYMAKVKEARQFEGKETKLRVNPKPVNRLEFSMHEKSRRLSKRRSGKDSHFSALNNKNAASHSEKSTFRPVKHPEQFASVQTSGESMPIHFHYVDAPCCRSSAPASPVDQERSFFRLFLLVGTQDIP